MRNATLSQLLAVLLLILLLLLLLLLLHIQVIYKHRG